MALRLLLPLMGAKLYLTDEWGAAWERGSVRTTPNKGGAMRVFNLKGPNCSCRELLQSGRAAQGEYGDLRRRTTVSLIPVPGVDIEAQAL